ncbi:hypothetical protein DB347_15400 [Opitutaceae bacterium EW11]|nr:hypothetical protein DB347_15400 [Opitutaceae bacterium EW11]
MSSAPLRLYWEIGHLRPGQQEPASWHPANVPGCAQQDVGTAEGLPDFRVGKNVTLWASLESSSFVYRARFSRPELPDGTQLFFHSDGIDYEAMLAVNGVRLARHVGPYSPIDLDLTPHLAAQNELRIEIAPVPRRAGFPPDRTQASDVFKPAVNYGWDFQPRLIPSGMWRAARLEKRAERRLDAAELRYELSADLRSARLRCLVSGAKLAGRRVRLSLLGPQGREAGVWESVLTADTADVPLGTLENVALWWPRHHGTPALYSWTLSLLADDGSEQDRREGQVGFRRVRLLMNEGSWKEPSGFPKSRSTAPIQFEINGRRIFVKGSNWVPPEVFSGSIGSARYTELIERALGANLDLLRVWGGGGPAHDAFYGECDRQGVLVWQEFPLACNLYPDSPDYLSVLVPEARAIVLGLRRHPCVAVWCGGNELFNSWSGMNDQALPLRALNAICLELDPATPFLATSPLEGMGHGYYRFLNPDTGEDVFRLMANVRATAYAEFGVPGPSPIHVLRSVLPEAELWPPRPGTAWETHAAFNSWTPDTWLDLPVIERYFGSSAHLEELIERGQLLQAEGLKCVYEEARRQKPHCSLAMNWCLADPWPCAANCSIIAYPNEPKPAYFAVAAACRPVLASARLEKFAWTAGELFCAELWLLNDRAADADAGIAAGLVHAWLETQSGRIELLRWSFPEAPANNNIAGPVARALLPESAGGRFTLHVSVEGRPEWNSVYTLLCRAPEDKGSKVVSTPALNQ